MDKSYNITGYNPNHDESLGPAVALIKKLTRTSINMPISSSIDGNPLIRDRFGNLKGKCALYTCLKLKDFLMNRFNPWESAPFVIHEVASNKLKRVEVAGYEPVNN